MTPGLYLLLAFCYIALCYPIDEELPTQTHSVARLWSREIIAACTRSGGGPTVNARTMFLYSVGGRTTLANAQVCMWDSWAAYHPTTQGYIFKEKFQAHNVLTIEATIRWVTLKIGTHNRSYTVFFWTKYHFPYFNNYEITSERMETLMKKLGLDLEAESAEKLLGQKIAAAIIEYSRNDGSNQEENFRDDTNFEPGSGPLEEYGFGNPHHTHVNNWQPLTTEIGQNQVFLTPHWKTVKAFSTDPISPIIDLSPKPPLDFSNNIEELRRQMVVLIRDSSWLTPDTLELVDASPKSLGNNSLGSYDGKGYTLNPASGKPYSENVVNVGDFTRCFVEFWLEEFDTPSVHMNVLFNAISDRIAEKRLGGSGEVISELEWDVKGYLVLNGALHNSAIVAWRAKRDWSTERPISTLRYMAEKGQCSDPNLPRHHEHGIPLVAGLIEMVTEETVAVGARHEGLGLQSVGEIAVRSWRGPSRHPQLQYSGAGWILLKNWLSYVFVPPFPGYISGHSTFCASWAQVMHSITGDAFLPGGLSEKFFSPGMLKVEFGPSRPLMLQWATYRDIGDQCGISRLYGGVHPAQDDLNGRKLGIEVGQRAWQAAQFFFSEDNCTSFVTVSLGGVEYRATKRGSYYADAVDLCSTCFNMRLAQLTHAAVLQVEGSMLVPEEYWIGSYEGVSAPALTLTTSPRVTIAVIPNDAVTTKGTICGM